MTTKLARDLVPGDRLPRTLLRPLEVLSVKRREWSVVSSRGKTEPVYEVEATDGIERGSWFWPEERLVTVLP